MTSTEDSMGLDHALDEILQERSPCCLLVPIPGYPGDTDSIGPFYSYENAKCWQAKLGERYPAYLNAEIRAMSTLETVIAIIQAYDGAPLHKEGKDLLRRHFGKQVRDGNA